MFGLVGWIVLSFFLIGTTIMGHFLGKSKNNGLTGFFKGDNTIPWWAVSGSLIATKTSALTFIAVPAAVFMEGGNLTFLQITIGFVLGNFLMASIFVKSYYEKSIFSPYDFMENRLGNKIGQLTRGLFSLGAVLSQGVRLLSTALVLSVITGLDLIICVGIIGVFAVIWSILGGITTVIWTDFIQFLIFIGGAIVSLLWLMDSIPDGWQEVLAIADKESKTVFLDISLDPTKSYTLWLGLFGSSIFELAQNSVDHVVTQRVLCCKNYKEAKKAVNYSAFGVLTMWIMIAVGLSLFAFYQLNPLDTGIASQMSSEPDRIFPYYIINELPEGLSSLLIAAIFAAGISTLDSALTALSQTTLSGVYQRLTKNKTEKHYVSISKLFILGWALIIMLLAIFYNSFLNDGLLRLGLKVPGFVYGALLGIALLALYKFGTFKSIFTSVILSIIVIIILDINKVSFFWWYPAGTVIVVSVTYFLERAKLKQTI